jgi:ferric-dicitrate binding protein FerR (iron transport regulator)
MNETDFATRLHACLDARRDPLDDQALCAWLAEHPEQLEAFAALRQRLAALPAAVPAARSHRRPRAALRLAVAAGIAAAVLAVAWPRSEPLPPVRGILAASLEERQPRAGAAVSFTVRQGWPLAPGVVLETYETRSQLR